MGELPKWRLPIIVALRTCNGLSTDGTRACLLAVFVCLSQYAFFTFQPRTDEGRDTAAFVLKEDCGRRASTSGHGNGLTTDRHEHTTDRHEHTTDGTRACYGLHTDCQRTSDGRASVRLGRIQLSQDGRRRGGGISRGALWTTRVDACAPFGFGLRRIFPPKAFAFFGTSTTDAPRATHGRCPYGHGSGRSSSSPQRG